MLGGWLIDRLRHRTDRAAAWVALIAMSGGLVIAVLSFLIGVIIDAIELRLAFGGVVIVMFGLGIVICLALVRTLRGDMARQTAFVEARVKT